MSKIEYSI